MCCESSLIYKSQDPYETYRRDYYEPDEVKIVQSSGDFSGKVIQRKQIDKEYAEITIDNAVTVTTVAKVVFKNAKDFWNEKKDNYLTKSIVVSAIGTSLIGNSGVMFFFYAIFPLNTFLIMAIVSTIIAFGCFAAALYCYNRKRQATQQLKQWNYDTTREIRQQRQMVKQEGFDYVFTSKLKGTVVHPHEMKLLWHDSMKKYFHKFDHPPVSTKHQAKLIHRFMTKGPLHKESYDYAFGSEPTNAGTGRLINVRGEFESLKSQYQNSGFIKEKKVKLDQNSDILHDHFLKSIRNLLWVYLKM